MGKQQSPSAELYLKFKDTKKASALLCDLADAAAEDHKTNLRKCGPLGRLLAAGRVSSLQPLFPTQGYRRKPGFAHAIRDGVRDDEDGFLYRLTFDDANAARRALRSLAKDINVEYVHGPQDRKPTGDTDPYRNRQWGLAAIELFQAQDAGDFEDGEVISVAVIDTGVDDGHPDLEEVGIETTNFTSGGLRDLDGHGTHVIGTIAAVINNDIGISGVCQTRQLHSLKALGPFNQHGYFQALRKVLDLEPHVLNLSLAGAQSPTEERLIARIIRAGTIVVAAMGNDGTSRKQYPAAYRDVIAVGASNAADGHWRKSNRGRHIDLVAPGVAIFSTTPRRRSSRAHNRMYDAEGWHGTSMAAAFVTGAVVLCLAKNLDADLEHVRSALHEGADMGQDQDGFTHRLGWGRLNVRRSLELI